MTDDECLGEFTIALEDLAHNSSLQAGHVCTIRSTRPGTMLKRHMHSSARDSH